MGRARRFNSYDYNVLNTRRLSEEAGRNRQDKSIGTSFRSSPTNQTPSNANTSATTGFLPLAGGTMTGDINLNDNELNNVEGIDFEPGGPAVTDTEAVIWADASGDLVFNVASGDTMFFTENGLTTRNFLNAESDFRATTQHGHTITLKNLHTGQANSDRVGLIQFQGYDSADSTIFTWGSIEFSYEDITAGAKQAQMEIKCQHDNAIVPIIDYTGDDAVFRFSSGVDIVRSNADGTVDLGADAQEWQRIWVQNIDTSQTGGLDVECDLDFDVTATCDFNQNQGTVGSAGSASALPAQPEGYVIIKVNGTSRVIPFYKDA